MKRVGITGRLAVFVAGSLLLSGCQNVTLSEITKRAKSVAGPVSGVDQKKRKVEVQERTLSRVASAPSNLVASRGASPTEIMISWEDGSRPASIYHVERSDDGGESWLQRGTVGTGVQTYSDHTLTSDNSFLYRVRTQQQVEQELLEKKRAEQTLEEQRVKEAERVAAEQRRVREAEERAREEAERLQREAAEFAEEEAKKRQQEVERRAQEEAERLKAEIEKQSALRAEEKRKSALAQKQKSLKSLLDGAERELAAGNLSAAEEVLKQYRTKQGDSTIGQKRYDRLLRQIKSMSQILADLEQTNDTERYLQKLFAEASALSRHGDLTGARKRYSEVISIDPTNKPAKEGLQALPKQPEKVVSKQSRKVKKGKSSLLGKSAAGWIVQVATYGDKNKKTAYSMLGMIKKAGFKGIFIKKQELAGRTLYRLRLGAYGDKSEATALRDRINGEMAEQGIVSRVTLQKR